MPFAALLLVVAAGLIHASWNLLAKRASAGADFVMIHSGLTCIVFAPFVFRQWESLPTNIDARGWVLVAASGILHFIYSLILQRGYQVADLSVLYPVARGTSPLLSFLGAIAFLGEPFNWRAFVGLITVVCGIVTVSGGQRFSALRPGLAYGAATGFCIALCNMVDALSIRLIGMPPLLVDYLSNLMRTLLLVPLMLPRHQHLREAMKVHGWAALGVAILSPLGYILVLYAMRMAPVTIIAPTREVSMLFVVVLGAVVLREPQGRRRLCGVALIAAGVFVLSDIG